MTTGTVEHSGPHHHTGTSADPRTRPAPPRRPGPGGSTWRIPVALVVLSVVPVVAGSLRLLEVAGGPQLLPTNPRIDAFPAPVVVHIVAAAFYALLGAFQFSTRLRRRRPRWHRRAGRLLVGAGLVVAASALWLTLAYPDAPNVDDDLRNTPRGHSVVDPDTPGGYRILIPVRSQR